MPAPPCARRRRRWSSNRRRVADPVVSVAVEARRRHRHRTAGDGAGAAGRGGPVAGRADRLRDRADRAVRHGRAASGGRGGEDPPQPTAWRSASAGRRWPTGRRSCAGCPGWCTGTSSRTAARASSPMSSSTSSRWTSTATARRSFEFRSTVVGGRVPQEYVRAVEAGCRDALVRGSARRAPGDRAAGHPDRRGDPSEGLVGAGVPHRRPASRSGRRCGPA